MLPRGAVLAACLLLTACGAQSGPLASPSGTVGVTSTAPPKPSGGAARLRFLAGYQPQANVSFVGPYVAQAKGYYREANLAVDIEHVARTGENFQALAENQADVTTGVGEDVVRLVQAGMPLLAIASVTQRGDHGFASLASSGIKAPKQWQGKTVGYKGAGVSIDYLALIKKVGVDRSSVKEVQIGYDPAVLVKRQVDVLPVFLSNEPDTIRSQLGFEVNVIDPADFGVVLMGQTWLVNRNQLAASRGVYERWLGATLRGLEYAFAHEDEAVSAVMSYAPRANREHQRAMLDIEREASVTAVTRARGLGWLTPEPWSATQDALLQTGQIPTKLDVSRYYDDELLRDVRLGSARAEE
jgi:ABC-type nitrate/sulfonate/bicarbonate transport system substrate-binding protein